MKSYFHGTPFSDAASSIDRTGLGGARPTRLNGGGGSDESFRPGEGRSYLTTSKWNALRYGLMNNDSDDAHVFEFDLDEDDNEMNVDEDAVGSIIYKYLNGKLEKLPFRKSLLKKLSKEDLDSIKKGEFRGYTSTKKIIDDLTKNEIVAINRLSISMTTKGVKMPSKHWVVKKPSDEEMRNINAKAIKNDFSAYDEYFERNKKLYK